LLVAALLTDVEEIAALRTLLDPPVVRSSEAVERRWLGLEVCTAFLGGDRAAHRRHPRQ